MKDKNGKELDKKIGSLVDKVYKLEVKPVERAITKAEYDKIKELGRVIPTLKKHGLEGTAQKDIQNIRKEVKKVGYTVELSRHFNKKAVLSDKDCETVLDAKRMVIKRTAKSIDSISLKETVNSRAEVYETLKAMKAKIVADIKKKRSDQKMFTREVGMQRNVKSIKQGRVHTEGSAFLKIYKRKLREDIFKPKVPQTEDQHYVGVELEFASAHDREFIADHIFDAGIASYINIKGDGSIRGDDKHNQTHEICVVAPQKEILDVIKKLCDVLNNKCDVIVNNTCGLHVHLDMRKRDYKLAFSNLVSMQGVFYRMMPGMRKEGQYAKPTKGKEWRVMSERYHGINSNSYAKHKTIEIRLHSGTTNKEKITNWIKLLVATADAPEIKRAPTNIAQVKAATGVDDGVLEYITKRLEKFRKQHSGEEASTIPNEEAA